MITGASTTAGGTAGRVPAGAAAAWTETSPGRAHDDGAGRPSWKSRVVGAAASHHVHVGARHDEQPHAW